MARKYIRLGSSVDIYGYDDSVYSESIEISSPIKCTATPSASDHLATLGDVGDAENAATSYTEYIVGNIVTHNGEVMVHDGEVVVA